LRPKKVPKIKPKPKTKRRKIKDFDIKGVKIKDRDKIRFGKVTQKGEIIIWKKKKPIRIKTDLPFDRALKVALETVDETLLGSTTVKKYSRIKPRRGIRIDTKKFRDRKSKSKTVGEIVERRSHRLDSSGEVSRINALKLLAQKIKKEKKKLRTLKTKARITKKRKTKPSKKKKVVKRKSRTLKKKRPRTLIRGKKGKLTVEYLINWTKFIFIYFGVVLGVLYTARQSITPFLTPLELVVSGLLLIAPMGAAIYDLFRKGKGDETGF
jgi:hypothetical protein